MISQTYAAWHLARLLAGCPTDPSLRLTDAPQAYKAVLEGVLQRGETAAMTAFEQALFKLSHDLAQAVKTKVFQQDIRQPPKENLDDTEPNDHNAAESSASSAPLLPREARTEGDWQTILKDHWLTEYCHFASHAAPMSPLELHSLLGLGALSTSIARRAVVQRGTVSVHANLYGLFVAPSTLYHKSTGFAVGRQLLAQAGLVHLLLPEMQTPESLVIELGVQQPPTISQWPKEAKELWLVERAFAAQRSLWLDEASRLFDAFSRDYTAALRTLVLQLYECPGRETFQTVSRGRQNVAQAYLAVLGATTPASIKTLLQREACWSEGLWPRFALVTPSSGLPEFKFLPQAATMPSRLVDSLKRLAFECLPQPSSAMTESGVKVESVQPLVAEVEVSALDRWEAYAKALGHTLLAQGAVDEQLFASYGRLPMMAMKVALLLACMDWAEDSNRSNTPLIRQNHWHAAQAITEEWRCSLHRLVSLTQTTSEERLQDRILQRVEAAERSGITLRDLQRQLHRRRDEMERVVEGMVKDRLLSEAVTLHANNTRTVRFMSAANASVGTVTSKEA
jgi:hypothetical protein